MNPPGRWYLVLVIHKKSKEEEKRRERERGVQTNQIQSHHLNLLFPSPKTFKDTTAKNISSISCKKKVTVYLQKTTNTHLATKYQQWHTEGRGLWIWLVWTPLSLSLLFSSSLLFLWITRTKYHLPGGFMRQPGGLYAAVGRLHLRLFHDLLFWKPVQWSWVQLFHIGIFSKSSEVWRNLKEH